MGGQHLLSGIFGKCRIAPVHFKDNRLRSRSPEYDHIANRPGMEKSARRYN
jgi:hypothetical protein